MSEHARILAAAHLPERTLGGLDQLDPRRCPEALAAARQFLADQQAGKRGFGLYLHGGLGTGKTTILRELAYDLARFTPWQIRYWTVPDLLSAIKRGFGSEDFDYAPIENCGVLLLDDLGKQYDTGWTISELFRLVDLRYAELRSTCFSSNYHPRELLDRLGEQLGESHVSDVAALTDRIRETCQLVAVTGTSSRRTYSREAVEAQEIPPRPPTTPQAEPKETLEELRERMRLGIEQDRRNREERAARLAREEERRRERRAEAPPL